MKLSTAIITGVVLAGASFAGTVSTAAAATVFEQYGYGLNVPDTDGAYIFVTTPTALTDVTISGGYGNGFTDFGAVAAGGQTGYYYLGDNEDSTPGSDGTALISIVSGGKTYSGSFTDVIGDLDASDAPVALGTLGPASAVSAAPEPNTWMLMLLAVGGIGAALRYSRKKPADAVTA